MNLSGLSNPKFADEVQKRWKKARDTSRKWRDEAKEDYRFYAGDQWSDADKRFLEDNNRPIVTFNRAKPVIDAIGGAELVNRQAVRYLPVSMDDGGKAEMYTETARWARSKTDAEDEESHAFMDSSICGMGWTETWVDFETELDGQIRIDRFSPMEAYWDPAAKRQNLADARWVARMRILTKEEIKERFPKKKILQDDGLNTVDDGAVQSHTTIPGRQYEEGSGAVTRREGMNVLQFQWYERKPIFRAQNPETGEIEEVAAENVPVLEGAYGDEIEIVRQIKREYWQALIVGKTVLSRTKLHTKMEQDGTSRNIPGFTLRCITGFWDEDKGHFFGVMRAMKDPQRWSNKFFSQAQDIFNSVSKGGIIAEKGAFADTRKAEADWTKPDRIVWVNDGALSTAGGRPRIQERPSARALPALDRLMGIAIQAVREVTGVSIEFLGISERTQAGVVERQRIAQGMVVLAGLFNALRRYRKEQGRVLLHMMRLYIPEGRIVRVTGKKPFKFQDDPSVVDFDIIVDQSPTSPNFKNEVWLAIRDILPAMIKAGFPIPPNVINYLPLPESVTEEFREFYASQGPSEEEKQMQALAKQLELEGMQADVALKKAQAVSNILKAQAAGEGIKAGVLREIIKAMTEGEKTDVDRARVIADSAKAGMETLVKVDGNRTADTNGSA